jgi:hypothetical protein
MLPFRSRMVTKIGQATPTRIEGMRAISNQDHQGTCSALPLAAVEGYVRHRAFTMGNRRW